MSIGRVDGDLSAFFRSEAARGAAAVTRGVSEQTEQLKAIIRNEVKTSGLGDRLANTWRSQVYPKGKESMGAAGLVFTKAPEIMISFEEGVIIHPAKKRMLAFPLPGIPKRIGGKRVTPESLEKAWGIKLVLVKPKPSPPWLLIAPARARQGKTGGFAAPTPKSLKSGRGMVSIKAFLVTPMVKMPKKFSLLEQGEIAQAGLPAAILKYWK